MYIPPAFLETDLQKAYELIEQHSFATLVSKVDGELFATHLPLLLDQNGTHVSLIGHTARANPQCARAEGQTVVAIFSGPHGYVSPDWYESENVVPTWNYVAVHVYGKIHVVEDQQALAHIVEATTKRYESARPAPWSFDPSTVYASRMLTQIVGFRLEIERIEGKWKISQNQPVERQMRVIAAFLNRGDENSRALAHLMQSRIDQAAK